MRSRRHRKRADTLVPEKKPFFQPKKNDLVKEENQGIKTNSQYEANEKQADAVADRISQNPDSNPVIQQDKDGSQVLSTTSKGIMKQEDEEVATKTQTNRKQEEDENSAAKMDIQTQEEEETSASLDLQPQEEEEQVSAKLDIRKQEEEEQVSAKLNIRKQEEEEQVSTKLDIRKQEEEDTGIAKMKIQAPPVSFEESVKTAKSNGDPLPDKIRKEMEGKLNFDLSRVRIHTDEEAIRLCRSIKAQAFTNGYHIFFNKGKFRPDTASGKHLLAHELTHVVQQKGK